MIEKKILFDGCSFTANNGFQLENQAKFHWPNLVSNHYQAEFKNLAIGGSSNTAIFNRVVEHTTSTGYDLVVVQWSEIGRYWAYHANHNVDDFTIIGSWEPTGFCYNNTETQQYAKLHQTYFDNHYVNLRQWMCQSIALAGLFDSQNQPYVFVKGFENYVKDFDHIEYTADTGFVNLSSDVQRLLDFDHRPDDYMLRKVTEIQTLLIRTKQLNWINFDLPGFYDSAVDRADDQMHPGPVSNSNFTKQFISYCDRKHLLTHD